MADASGIDKTKSDEIMETALDLAGMYSGRNTLYDQADQAYLMTWAPANADPDNRVIQDPSARNAVEGAVRLLSMTEPKIEIKSQGPGGFTNADELETSVARAWVQSGRAIGAPLLRDLARSLILYGQFDVQVQLTSDLVARAKKSFPKSPAAQRSIERLAERTPWLYSVMSPKAGAWMRGPFGLTHYYRKVETTVGWVKGMWGALAEDIGGKHSQTINYHTYYDQEYYQCWTDSGVLWQVKHEFPRLPIVVQQADATNLFSKPEEQSQPFLYAMLKSGLWDAQNIMLTVFFSLVRNIGLVPLFSHIAPPEQSGKRLDGFNFDTVPAVVELDAGEQFIANSTKGLLPPEVNQALQLATQKVQESTIFPQALGAPPSGTMTFSAMSMLNQAGRLPLSGPQLGGSWGVAELVEISLELLKDSGKGYDSNGIKIQLADIPDALDVEVKLDIDLPQDKLQLSNIAVMLKTNGLADDEWIQTNILNEPNSKEMKVRVWTQKNLDLIQQASAQIMVQQLVQQMQQAQAAKTLPGGSAPSAPPTAPEQVPPPGPMELQAGAQMPEGQADQMGGGLPPEMAGMLPGQGQGNVPPNGQGGY